MVNRKSSLVEKIETYEFPEPEFNKKVGITGKYLECGLSAGISQIDKTESPDADEYYVKTSTPSSGVHVKPGLMKIMEYTKTYTIAAWYLRQQLEIPQFITDMKRENGKYIITVKQPIKKKRR